MYFTNVFYIRIEDKAFYTVQDEYAASFENCWVISPEDVMPYLMEFPQLFTPQTVH